MRSFWQKEEGEDDREGRTACDKISSEMSACALVMVGGNLLGGPPCRLGRVSNIVHRDSGACRDSQRYIQ
jgi:hypothetical protein